MYGHSVIQIIDKVALHAINDLDLSGGMPGIWKSLDYTVVCDGDGRMAPGLCPLDNIPFRTSLGTEGRQGIHIGK